MESGDEDHGDLRITGTARTGPARGRRARPARGSRRPSAAGRPGPARGRARPDGEHVGAGGRFRRDREHKVLAGVCAGLGRQCDMDPV
ncbi:PspC domain-containing protein, partial [Streptomyces sp. NPDC005486]|uniref:PspC domain-containing protein n=1 Tax=Streptomyces sp. NPDC005486 TaxID=3155345 RepID=UPI0033ABEAE9